MTQLRKESLGFRRHQGKPPKLKKQKEQRWKITKQTTQGPLDNHKSYNIHIMGITGKGERERNRRNI